MHVHRAARFALHRRSHECGVDLVSHGDLPQPALEQKHLVGEIQCVTVQQVDLHLRRTRFMDQSFNAYLLNVAIVVKILKQRIEFVDRVDAEGLATALCAPRATRPAVPADSPHRCWA